jgi:fatty-acyl-CoA synthase
MIECRESDAAKRAELIDRMKCLILEELGIDSLVYLVPRNTLPRTTSGKLSRFQARAKFLEWFNKNQMTESAVDFYAQAI